MYTAIITIVQRKCQPNTRSNGSHRFQALECLQTMQRLKYKQIKKNPSILLPAMLWTTMLLLRGLCISGDWGKRSTPKTNIQTNMNIYADVKLIFQNSYDVRNRWCYSIIHWSVISFHYVRVRWSSSCLEMTTSLKQLVTYIMINHFTFIDSYFKCCFRQIHTNWASGRVTVLLWENDI